MWHANQTSFKEGHKFIKGGEKGWFKNGIIPKTKWKKGEHASPKTEFKKGQKAWNKGLEKWWNSPRNFKKGHVPLSKTNPEIMPKDAEHHRWKGDRVGYEALHTWIARKLGKPTTCEMCGKSGLTGRKIHWANVDHKYKRKLSDWMRLCVPCHIKYDKNLLLKQRKYVRN